MWGRLQSAHSCGADLWSLRNKCNHQIKAGAKFPCRGAAFEPSPAFQSRESGYVVVSVAERRLIPMIGINRRSATENGYALVAPALKSRAKFTWSLRDRKKLFALFFQTPLVITTWLFSEESDRQFCKPSTHIRSNTDCKWSCLAPNQLVRSIRPSARAKASSQRPEHQRCRGVYVRRNTHSFALDA